MTKQHDKGTKFRPFTQGQNIWLEGTNLKLTHPTAKLAPWRYSPFCYAQALGVVVVESLSVELSGKMKARNGRPSCRATQGQNHGVRRGCRGLKGVRQLA